MSSNKYKQGVLSRLRNRSLIDRALVNLILWLFICGLLTAFLFPLLDTGSSLFQRRGTVNFAPSVLTFIWMVGFNIASADVLWRIVKRHERNTVAWTTAIIVFTPIMAGIVYLLTWPKDRKLAGLR